MDDPEKPAEPDPGQASAQERGRDRPATERRILDSAQKILTEQGPAGLGVNAIARAAGVDKQLIYRYFGGLDGLLAALGERIAQWWQDRLLEGTAPNPPATYGEMIEGLAVRLLQIMRSEPLAMQTALWELSDTSGLVAPLAASRARVLGAWMAKARGALKPPEGVDAPAVNAMIVSGISYIVLASRTASTVIGLATREEATWERIEMAIRQLVRCVYLEHGREPASATM